MRKLAIILAVLILIILPVEAMEFTAPAAPDSATENMPKESTSFGADLWYIVKSAINRLQPNLTEALGVCISLIAVIMLVSILQSFTGIAKRTVDLVCTLSVSILLIQPSNSLIHLGVETVEKLSEYGKMLAPVMTAALAAEGGVTTSTALYTGTIAFNAILTTLISKLIIPLIYIYVILCIASRSLGESLLEKIRDFIKWLMTWCLKISIYLFTGYLSITGVVSGTADASAIKAAKLAFNGFVPVVGNIISDASETVLVSAGIMKTSVGIYGLLAIIATWISPFLQIGIRYLLLKITASVCSVFGSKETVGLITDFSGTMGFILAMTGTECLLLLISTVCFMKGVS